MFDNIAKLRFEEGSSPNELMATGMISSENEEMVFKQPVSAEGRVEDWMTKVLEEMRKTNHLITKEAIFKYCENCTRYKIARRKQLYYSRNATLKIVFFSYYRQ